VATLIFLGFYPGCVVLVVSALRAHVISAISRSLIAKLTYEVFVFVACPQGNAKNWG